MADKARHAYGSRANLNAALEAGTIDAFDVLFLNGEGETPAIGWVDKDGNPIIIESGGASGDGSGVSAKEIVRVDELPTADGDENVIYIYNNEAYVWDGTQCVSIAKPADLTELEKEVATKVDADTVQSMIEAYADSVVEVVEF